MEAVKPYYTSVTHGSITSNNAAIAATCNNPSKMKLTKGGFYISTKSGAVSNGQKYTDNIPSSYQTAATIPCSYNLKNEYGYSLQPGVTYYYVLYVTDSSGTTYYSDEFSFRTPYTKVTGITVSPGSKTLDVGGKVQLQKTVSPSNATYSGVNWSSSNSAVAIVDSNGVVTAVGRGTAEIRATATDGTGVYGSATITVSCSHNYGYVTIPGTDATCTKDGLTEGRECAACDEIIVAQQTVKATGHKEVTDAAVAATCTRDGRTAGKHCSVCGTVTVAQQTVRATGHKEVTDAAVAATCTRDGKTAGKHCSVCGIVTVAQQTVMAYGHNYADGKCTVCGSTDPNHTVPIHARVVRLYGPERYSTAASAAEELKKILGVEKFQNIIVACGTNFPDALSGTYLAAVKQAPILLVKGSFVGAVNDYIRENLAPGGTVYLLGDNGVVPDSVGRGISGIRIKRLGGNTRYDTNLLILQEAGIAGKDIIVCTGTNFADSLSASAVGLPILLVKDGLYANQKEFLKSVSGNFIIVGGTNAVNTTVEKQLASYGRVSRVAGTNRYETSVKVAQRFFHNPSTVVLAYAQNFPDGLSGGPLAYATKAPLILTDNNKPGAAKSYAESLIVNKVYIMGGFTLIVDKTVDYIFNFID